MITYEFRLYPSKTQSKIMDETLETCRKLYNSLLSDRIENGSGFYEQRKKLVRLKADNKFLKTVHSQVLQDVSLRLDKAFQCFFAGLSRYPRFKRRGRYNSFSYPQHKIGFSLSGNFLKLGKIGRIRIRLHREIIGTIKRATLIKDIDHWFVAFSIEQQEGAVPEQEKEASAVGVDMGITNVVALSSGETISNPKFLKQSAEKIKHLQRELSRKKKGSNRREKTKLLLAKSSRKVRRQRDDFAHKLSFKLAKENESIVFEDLKIQNMVKNHNLASAILDSTWGKLRQLTAYKAEGEVDELFSSTQMERCRNAHGAEKRFQSLCRRECINA
jgi:putative transposase